MERSIKWLLPHTQNESNRRRYGTTESDEVTSHSHMEVVASAAAKGINICRRFQSAKTMQD